MFILTTWLAGVFSGVLTNKINNFAETHHILKADRKAGKKLTLDVSTVSEINIKFKEDNNMSETMMINGEEWARKADAPQMAEQLDGMEYCMVRTYSAGVFAAYVQSRDGKEATLRHARRIWYWDGAASLSQLAMEGTKKPENCKFPCEVDTVILTEVVEIIPMTEKAKKSIAEVPVWEA